MTLPAGTSLNRTLLYESFSFPIEAFSIMKYSFVENICLDHVIWTGCWVLKLVSKFDCLFTFLVFAVSKKMNRPLWNLFIKITQPFLYLEGALKLISQEHFKNTTTKIFKIQHKFCHSTTCPNDMIRTID